MTSHKFIIELLMADDWRVVRHTIVTAAGSLRQDDLITAFMIIGKQAVDRSA